MSKGVRARKQKLESIIAQLDEWASEEKSHSPHNWVIYEEIELFKLRAQDVWLGRKSTKVDYSPFVESQLRLWANQASEKLRKEGIKKKYADITGYAITNLYHDIEDFGKEEAYAKQRLGL